MPQSFSRKPARFTLALCWSVALWPTLHACHTNNGAAKPLPSVAQATQTVPAVPALARVELQPPGREPVTFRVEVVSTQADRARGLMYRQQLDPDAGMLFLFQEPEHLRFWMKNTYLPLDMIFIEPQHTVLGVVENAEPQTESSREVAGQSQFVLEVNAGLTRQYGIGPGTQARFLGVAGEN